MSFRGDVEEFVIDAWAARRSLPRAVAVHYIPYRRDSNGVVYVFCVEKIFEFPVRCGDTIMILDAKIEKVAQRLAA